MNLSEHSYAKAKLMLEYIKKNPDIYMPDVAAAVELSSVTARNVAHQMVKAGVLTFKAKNIGKGKRNYYRVTGIKLPPRNETFVPDTYYGTNNTLDPVDIETYRRLPGFLRALMPVIVTNSKPSKVVSGHTVEQHKLQSAVIRKDRATALQGIKYSGESRI